MTDSRRVSILALVSIGVLSFFACCHNSTPPIIIDQQQPSPIVIGEPPPTNTDPVQPPPGPVNPPVSGDAIGALNPEAQLSAADSAIISQVLNGPKSLDNQRNRILLAGCNYPGTQSSLTYCVFDVQVRHLLGLVKKFKIDPADIRLVLDREYTKANLVKHIDWIFDGVQPGDKRAIFMSSHGAQDTLSDGSTAGVVCTWDMISQGAWNADTEIQLPYWQAKCRSVPPGSNVLLLFDLCYSGSDIRALFANPGHKTARSVTGPPVVQARVEKATVRALMRDANQYSIQWFPMCLDSELSSEGSRTGGAGSWSWWSSIDKNGVDALSTLICRDANAYLRSNQDTQHITVLGRNNKQPIFVAQPAPVSAPAP